MARCTEGCGYYWQEVGEAYPRCHYDDPWPAPCEYDNDYDDEAEYDDDEYDWD